MFPALREQIATWIEDGTIEIPPDGARCVEIGALNVNGTVRDLFPCEYVGVDRVAGPGVDVVMDGWGYFENRRDAAHTVICLESLEHDPSLLWFTAVVLRGETMQAVISVPSFDGAKVMPYHDYGGDYWRFSEQSVRDVLLAGMTVKALARVHDTNGCESIVAVGVK